MSDGMTQAMTRYETLTLDHGQLKPRGAGEIILLAEYLVRHGMGYGHTVDTAVGAITKALELGRSPTWGLQNVAMIHDRPMIWGAGLKGLAVESSACKGMVEGAISGPEIGPFLEDDWSGSDDESRMMRAVQRRVRVRWLGLTDAARKQADYILAFIASIRGDTVRVNLYDILEARQAGLVGGKGGMYEKHPRRMVLARATGYHVRDVYPEHMVGGMTAEEALDGDGDPRIIDTTATERPDKPEKPKPQRKVADLVEPEPTKPQDAEIVEPEPQTKPAAEADPPPQDNSLGDRLAAVKAAIIRRTGQSPSVVARSLHKAAGKSWADMTQAERLAFVESEEAKLRDGGSAS